MSDLIYKQDAIDEIKRFAGYIDDDMVNRISIGLRRLPSAEPRFWKERYEDLLEYMHGEDTILKDRKEFKAWLERCRWHVLECDKLARQLEAQPEQHWIPVSERLPEKDGYYLTTTSYGQVYCDVWNEDHHFDRSGFVIAWMPLPEPYRKEHGNG